MKLLLHSQWLNIVSGLVGSIGMILQGFDLNFAAEDQQTIINFAMMLLGLAGCFMTDSPVRPTA